MLGFRSIGKHFLSLQCTRSVRLKMLQKSMTDSNYQQKIGGFDQAISHYLHDKVVDDLIRGSLNLSGFVALADKRFLHDKNNNSLQCFAIFMAD